jgi:hypothetical protein
MTAECRDLGDAPPPLRMATAAPSRRISVNFQSSAQARRQGDSECSVWHAALAPRS